MIKRWVVYLAWWKYENGPVKIGCTSDLKSRLRELQIASPYEVVMERVILTDHKEIAQLLERSLHRELREFRLRGEWFRNVSDVWDIFAKYEKDGLAAASEQNVDQC